VNLKTITVKQVKSSIGRLETHQACLKGLGISRMHRKIRILATPENMGMIKKIAYMLAIEES